MIEASIQSGNKQPIDLSRLADVRRRAFEQGISVIQILDETGGYTPDELVQQLGKLLHMPVLEMKAIHALSPACLLYTSPSPRDRTRSRMPSSA